MSVDLILGAVDLLGVANTSPGWWIEAGGDDMSFGSPADVESTVQSFLQDGAVVTVESRDNREMTLPVRIRATSVANLAIGEAALVLELGKRSLLTYTPSGNGPQCVFEVVTSSLAADFDDVQEANALASVYSLTIKALPWVRSATAVVSPWAGGGASPTVASVDACTATTGWSATATEGASAVSTSGGAVHEVATFTHTDFGANITLTKTGLSATMTTTIYARVDMTVTLGAGSFYGSPAPPRFSINGGSLVTADAQDGNIFWVKCTPSTMTSLKVQQNFGIIGGSLVDVAINDISRSSQPYDVLRARQSFRTVAVAGSARTPASIALADTTPTALGSVLVYTSPANISLAQPNLRARLSSGNTETADSTVVSGKTSPINTSVTAFDTPANQMPFGGYLLMARVKSTSGSFDLLGRAYAVLDGDSLGTISQRNSNYTITANTWTIITVAQFVLPTRRMGSLGINRVDLSSQASGLTLDEAWLFNMDVGDLTWLEAGAGTPGSNGPANRVWIDSPTLDNPAGSTAWLGTAADRSDSFVAGSDLRSPGEHKFVPPLMNLFLVTSGSTTCGGSMTYFPHWHTRAAS